ncbi:hypothetical protein [Streptomyces hygroscopicus]|uniref:hypothetical protein n=1 Tax=Streptomyces hygroscopicus TaxID=1912 RepID=UPI000783700C|nr:hypothetical protein [Streptomyces hygroscopicus]
MTITDIARATQAAAAHVIAARGVKSPAALVLLLPATTTAGTAMDASHPVQAIHPLRKAPDEHTQPHSGTGTA